MREDWDKRKLDAQVKLKQLRECLDFIPIGDVQDLHSDLGKHVDEFWADMNTEWVKTSPEKPPSRLKLVK